MRICDSIVARKRPEAISMADVVVVPVTPAKGRKRQLCGGDGCWRHVCAAAGPHEQEACC
eukprot:4358412-Lingulodinium_polyedra.AAC.1